ncbi:TonB-dependent receptor domain-containing protein [Aquibium microcysteis]|uniref:TonB-dependent receptor domain-containing protein n=1 Tax=Aquibium microcysteis TaxID=675281 RepID=UPI001EF19331|nr:TonB-dependent receptor [Aquibium microcysteis]
MAALLAAPAIPASAVIASTDSLAQVGSQTTYDIPSGSLSRVLAVFGSQSGTQVSYEASIAAGKTSPGISGAATREQAIVQILRGSGLSWSFTDPTSVVITDRAAAARDGGAPSDGSLVLDTIDVTGGGESSVYSPYATAAPSSHVSGETIERFRGSSPADMFRGTPGVMSGEARNGAGSIDPNIRGMQGMGRVATTIDGAENGVTIYQGYQGLSNRTFVDPDFIAGIDITKGADAGAWGNAGSVAMRTVGADDIVKPGDTWGVRVKGSIGGNTSDPMAGNRAGYLFRNPLGSANDPASGYGSATASPTGLNRPSFLSPTSGSSSVVGAYKGEGFDLLAGYARRSRGNYHAGTRGPAARPIGTGPRPFCYSGGYCPPEYLYRDVVENEGLANYRAGEEVLNTQLETESWLVKLNADIGNDQTLQLGYTGFRSEAGDRLASAQAGPMSQAIQQKQTTGTSLDTMTARYRWNPEDNDLVDVKANAYWSHLEQRNPLRAGAYNSPPNSLGLRSDYRSGSDSDLWGADVSNLSKFTFGSGDLDLTYGLSYRGEDTRGSNHAAALETWLTPRDAIRHEIAGFAKASYKPAELDWLTLNAGLRYSHFWSKDRVDPYSRSQIGNNRVVLGHEIDAGGFSPSLGVTVEPFDGTQFYVNYANAMRAPSIIETVSAFNSVVANDAVRPERSSNWEIGANFNLDRLMGGDDRAMLKLGYFNWDVKDYLARNIIVDPSRPGQMSMNIGNIDRAKFSGLELSSRYEINGFTAELTANYFLNVEYCRTAASCGAGTLYGDYATNHVQPKYTVDVALSQKLFEDRLTLGGRVSYVGPRAIGHGDVTAQGAQQFIAPVLWKPYTLADVFAEYKISDDVTATFRVENLFDTYYVDPLGLVTQPGPGRTFSASLTGSFGGDQKLPSILPPFFGRSSTGTSGSGDWTGAFAGVHGAGGVSGVWGSTTALDGTPDAIAATESANLNMTSGLFGLQAGYNWHLGNGIVFGTEGDWSKSWMSGKQKAVSTEGELATAGSTQALTYYDVDWTASLRGRLGYALGERWMIYGTGGVALAGERRSREQYKQPETWSTETVIASVEREDKTRVGYIVGAGAEYVLNENWSVDTSYSYSRFGSTNFDFKSARAGAQTGSYDSVNGRRASDSLDLHAIKIGLNYRF